MRAPLILHSPSFRTLRARAQQQRTRHRRQRSYVDKKVKPVEEGALLCGDAGGGRGCRGGRGGWVRVVGNEGSRAHVFGVELVRAKGGHVWFNAARA